MLFQQLGGDEKGLVAQEGPTPGSLLGEETLGQLLKPPAVLTRSHSIPHLQCTDNSLILNLCSPAVKEPLAAPHAKERLECISDPVALYATSNSMSHLRCTWFLLRLDRQGAPNVGHQTGLVTSKHSSCRTIEPVVFMFVVVPPRCDSFQQPHDT